MVYENFSIHGESIQDESITYMKISNANASMNCHCGLKIPPKVRSPYAQTGTRLGERRSNPSPIGGESKSEAGQMKCNQFSCICIKLI
jgi:hypothetical protein